MECETSNTSINYFKNATNEAERIKLFPDRFKHAMVIAIPKPGKYPTSPNRYS